jgi:integrase
MPVNAGQAAAAALAGLPPAAVGAGVGGGSGVAAGGGVPARVPGHARRAHFADPAWYAWCGRLGVPPLAARRHHLDRWVAEQLEDGAGARPAAAATVARRLSCLSGLYEYAVVDVGLIDASPVVRVKRPKVSDRSSTTGLTEAELIRLLAAADVDGPRSAALVTLLALNGLRIGEALAVDVGDLTYDFGHGSSP